MEYICKRCGYTTTTKCNFLKHLQRKIPCDPILMDISIDEMKESLERKYKTDHHSCKYCAKKFNTHQSMYRHMKICKGGTDKLEVSKKNFEALVEKVKELENKCNQPTNTTNNGTINNITNNNTVNNYIVLRNFGSETLDHLPNHFLTSCFMMQDIPSLIENIFFDNECPENHNVKLKSIKNKMVEVYQDNKWTTKKSDEVLNQLVDKGSTILQRHYKRNPEDIKADMTEEEINDILDWLYQIVRDNEKIRKSIKDALLAMMDNYRSQVCIK